MFFLSLGDPAAAIVGRRMPGPRLLGKSPGGTAAFAAVGAAVAGARWWASEPLSITGALWAGAVIAALVELAGIPPDDNPDHPSHCGHGDVGYDGGLLTQSIRPRPSSA